MHSPNSLNRRYKSFLSLSLSLPSSQPSETVLGWGGGAVCVDIFIMEDSVNKDLAYSIVNVYKMMKKKKKKKSM